MTLPKASVGASRTPCFRRTDGTQTISRCPARGNHVRKPFQYRNASCTASTGEGQASCPGSPWSRTFRRPDLPGSKAGQADDSFHSCGPLGAGRRRSRERGRFGRRRAATARERCRVYGCFLHVTGIRARLHVNSRSSSGHAHTKPRSTARRRACPSNIGRHPRGSVGCPDETRLTGGAKYPPICASPTRSAFVGWRVQNGPFCTREYWSCEVTVLQTACAMRRTVVSPAQRAEMRGDISGSDGLPESERMQGKIACQETGGRAQVSGAVRREIRVI